MPRMRECAPGEVEVAGHILGSEVDDAQCRVVDVDQLKSDAGASQDRNAALAKLGRGEYGVCADVVSYIQRESLRHQTVEAAGLAFEVIGDLGLSARRQGGKQQGQSGGSHEATPELTMS